MESGEVIYFSESDIQITNKRAVFGSKTYAMRNVSSVSKKIIYTSKTVEALFAVGGAGFAGLIGLLMIVSDEINVFQIVFFLGSLLFTVLGVWLYRRVKNSYSVQISSSSGEVKAFTSQNEDLVSSIVHALSEAIIQGVD